MDAEVQSRGPDRAIAALAAGQHGVVSRAQLARLGIGRGAVARRLEAGRLHALHRGPEREELRQLLAEGAPDGDRLERALDIVRSDGSIEHARGAVGEEVRRAVGLANQLPDGAARHALVQLARFLATRCGADPGDVDA